MSHPPTINTPPQGSIVAVVGDVYRFLATGKETDGRYALWEALVPPGGGPPPHVHSREEEGFYVLDGEITFTVNGERVVARAGTFANMPVGTPHSFRNEGDRPAKMLISVAPAGLEQMFFEIGVPWPREQPRPRRRRRTKSSGCWRLRRPTASRFYCRCIDWVRTDDRQEPCNLPAPGIVPARRPGAPDRLADHGLLQFFYRERPDRGGWQTAAVAAKKPEGLPERVVLAGGAAVLDVIPRGELPVAEDQLGNEERLGHGRRYRHGLGEVRGGRGEELRRARMSARTRS